MNVITQTEFKIEALFLNSQRAQYTNFSLHENPSALKGKKKQKNIAQDLNLLRTFESIL